MILLARSERVKALAQRQSWLSGLASRFVCGGTPDDAIGRAVALAHGGITASMFYLGEYVTDAGLIRQTCDQLASVIATAGAKSLDVCVSCDPTQIGLMANQDDFVSNARTLARAILAAAPNPRPGHDTLMIDMEDAGVTQSTLDAYWTLHDEGLPVAVTIQAYLHRTRTDLDRLVDAGAWVRLVKGAFAEPARVAVRSTADRDSRFRQCVSRLLSDTARTSGVYPSFATHDHRMIEEIIAQAEAHGWGPETYEFEFLYGVRPDLERSLVKRGHRVRLYLPFGRDWFPYAIRRVGESPRNMRFVAKTLGRHGVERNEPRGDTVHA